MVSKNGFDEIAALELQRAPRLRLGSPRSRTARLRRLPHPSGEIAGADHELFSHFRH
jgi:hypothetical protein